MSNELITTQENIPVFENQEKQEKELLRGIPTKPSNKVEQVPTEAPMPYLRTGKVVNIFRQLKRTIQTGAGFDFLAKCADVMRDKGFKSNKIGVANRSRHKCGDAIDIDQENRNLIVVSEPHGLQQYFRVWLKCSKQDGTLGVETKLRDIRGHTVKGWYFDFTSAAERLGWQRIPAWAGWRVSGVNYTKMEFWHYQCTEGLSYDEAMDFLYNPLAKVLPDSRKPAPERILGLNDRGSAVRNIQEKLSRILDKNRKFYLSRDQIDGVFGKITQTAVKRLQEDYNIDADGLVGPNTRLIIEQLS